MKRMPDSTTTHFGFQQVAVTEKNKKVAAVFDSVATKYDVMNDLMSFGLHRLWKRFALDMTTVRAGDNILDLAGGTGDLSKQLASKVGTNGRVYLADINAAMLQQGRDRLLDEGISGNIHYLQVNAEILPFKKNSLDAVMMAFGLRNVTHKEKALAAIYHVLKPGGQFSILEFSTPIYPGLQTLYDLYSFNVLPKLGKWVASDADSYRYLAESIRMHPNQQQLQEMLETAGFEECDYYNLNGGIVALHRGYKL